MLICECVSYAVVRIAPGVIIFCCGCCVGGGDCHKIINIVQHDVFIGLLLLLFRISIEFFLSQMTTLVLLSPYHVE